MEQFHKHLIEILTSKYSGYKPNRTGIDTISLFGYQNQYDLSEGFPLITTKKMFTKSIIVELLWFLRGDTNIKYLVDNGVSIWDGNAFQHYLVKQGLDKQYPMYSSEWNKQKDDFIQKIKNDSGFAKQWGDLGPVYGKQWRRWEADGKQIDQLAEAINLLKTKPSDRRIIVSAWNPIEVKNMALPPCHLLYHFNTQDGRLDCQLYQRSCDMFLGVPFNIASYAFLTNIIADQTGLKPGRFVHTFGDSHIYCGKNERGKFYGDNLDKLKEMVRKVQNREEFLAVNDWIDKNAPQEREGEEGQDHITACLEQLSREPKQLPTLKITQGKKLEDLTYDDFKVENYNSYPAIRRAMAV